MQIIRSSRIKLLSLASPCEFDQFREKISRDASFYIDHDLGKGRLNGLEWAKVLYDLGHQNLYLSTGYSKESFADVSHLKGIVSKEAPWV